MSTGSPPRAQEAPTIDPSPLLRGGTIDVPVVGHSMRPLLRDGDRVRVRSLRPSEPDPGQIVLYVARGQWVMHRVLRTSAARVKTRGDASWSADAPVERVAVLGVATEVERWGRWFRLEWPLPLARTYRRAMVAARVAKRLLTGTRGRTAP